MWNRIAEGIIRYRLPLSLMIGVITVFMGFYAAKVEMSYEFARTVPPDDPDMVYHDQFKAQFGEDANLIAVGLKDSAAYTLSNFNALRQLTRDIRKIEGVTQVLALPNLKTILKDTVNARFYLSDIFSDTITTQAQLDSLLKVAKDQRIYADQLINTSNGATMMLVSVKKEVMNSPKRVGMTQSLLDEGKRFEDKTKIQLRYAGLPFIRTVVANALKREMNIFLIASALVTGIIMLVIFRSFRAVLFSMIIIGILVVWTLGTLELLGFKITLLSGLIPPVIVTIGVTNAIYLLNKYHLEFARLKDKKDAITSVVQKMGLAMFLTNLTVAIGFLTLLATDITILREFGIVAGINILALFFVCLIMIPSVLYWLPVPSEKHLRHLHFNLMNTFLKTIDMLVQRRRVWIYLTSIVVAVISVWGISLLHSVTYMVDDVPEESQVKRDLKFFESNFSGFLPLEMMVEFKTKKKRPILDVKNLKKIESFETFLDSIPVMSKPLSVLSFIKASKQAFYNGNPEKYALPSKTEGAFIMRYMKGETDNSGLFKSFVDSTFSKMRISCQIADIGSNRLDSLVHLAIEPRMKQIFASQGRDSIATAITGSTKIFIKGNKFLVANLKESLLLAIVLITISMAILFTNLRMIIISLIPNLLALIITAGLMGFFHIPLKASTALIFSITFGISVDNSIRFLAKYRQEILSNTYLIPLAVTDSIMETGKSIIYTSVVLFAGFMVFAFSSFGGTIALGLLTSLTLVISMFTNIILLPALIMTFDKPKKGKGDNKETNDGVTAADGGQDDEKIDLSKIKIHNQHPSAE
ncbi:MAG: efflux RND transporter permease subunit [Chryseolinea sp.]